MHFSSETIDYSSTGSFSKIVSDYLAQKDRLKDFYTFSPDLAGIEKAIAERKNFPVNRKLLVDTLHQQYSNTAISAKLKTNIDLLLDENTFTICTAHQPNIFTGHLYFIYKILHAVKLSDELNKKYPANKFVPVYYMGSEDADLDELGEVHVFGESYKWDTDQKGAVGRMKIDKAFMKLIDAIEARIAVEAFGKEIIADVRAAYKEGVTVEEATFHFVHGLFNSFGLVILLPDDAELKRSFSSVIKKELEEKFSEKEVNITAAAFPHEYKVQAAGREINLFYLKDDLRERIEADNDGFKVVNTDLHFSKEQLYDELENNPERFSPNVILRPVFQEMILPDIAFIGGGGELAYWLELKKVFEAVNVFFPVLVLRNSFTIINEHALSLLNKLGFTAKDIFRDERELMNEIVKKNSQKKLTATDHKEHMQLEFAKVQEWLKDIDPTLLAHADAMLTRSNHWFDELEKKAFRAEKKKYAAQMRQIVKLKAVTNPGGSLQERHDNILQYFSVYGKDFLNILYDHSLSTEQQFLIIQQV